MDDFIAIIPAASQHIIPKMNAKYIQITDILGIPRNESKDQLGTVLPVLGLEIDLNLFTLCVPKDKLAQSHKATSQALCQSSIT